MVSPLVPKRRMTRTLSCGLSDGSRAGDWRLPNIRELESLIDYGFTGPALSNAAGTNKATATDTPFTGGPVPNSNYSAWSSTTYAPDTSRAWVMKFHCGQYQRAGGGKDPHKCRSGVAGQESARGVRGHQD
jgi:hypothetical protein